jgi:hypothetical protein
VRQYTSGGDDAILSGFKDRLAYSTFWIVPSLSPFQGWRYSLPPPVPDSLCIELRELLIARDGVAGLGYQQCYGRPRFTCDVSLSGERGRLAINGAIWSTSHLTAATTAKVKPLVRIGRRLTLVLFALTCLWTRKVSIEAWPEVGHAMGRKARRPREIRLAA